LPLPHSPQNRLSRSLCECSFDLDKPLLKLTRFHAGFHAQQDCRHSARIGRRQLSCSCRPVEPAQLDADAANAGETTYSYVYQYPPIFFVFRYTMVRVRCVCRLLGAVLLSLGWIDPAVIATAAIYYGCGRRCAENFQRSFMALRRMAGRRASNIPGQYLARRFDPCGVQAKPAVLGTLDDGTCCCSLSSISLVSVQAFDCLPPGGHSMAAVSPSLCSGAAPCSWLPFRAVGESYRPHSVRPAHLAQINGD
jgi:hypothetical protein